MNVPSNLFLVGSAVVFKRKSGKVSWLLTKQKEDDDWGFPTSNVRKAESSVKTVIRIMGERGGMRAKVLEEVGRIGGATTINGKTLPLRQIYYLMLLKDQSGEPIGFAELDWFEYAKAVRNLKTKTDRAMIKKARELLKELDKKRKEKKKENQA